jgi:1,4-alpha-glucan branching enzyme
MQPEAALSPAPSLRAKSHQTIGVTFSLVDPEAKQVSVCGEFNDWTPNATPLTRKANGRWETTLALRAGRYQYKFVADGRWLHDPKAHENIPNPHGSLNSVVEVST